MTSLPPTSPTKEALRYFLENKEEELKRLNERLALYISKLKTVEESNSKLIAEKKTLEESTTKLTTEITTTKKRAEADLENLRALYESKLVDVNRLLEEARRQKAREQSENRRNTELVDELKKK